MVRSVVSAVGTWIVVMVLASCSSKSGGGGGGGDPQGLVTQGQYQCYTLNGGELMPVGGENFAITGPGSYTDASGAGGTYAFDGATSVLTFSGAALDGHDAKFDGTANPKTITLLDAQGNLADCCDLQ